MIRKLFSLATLTLLLASCTNAIDSIENLWQRTGADSKLPVFYATIEGNDDAATKVFADDQMRVLWNADDRITVFNKYSYGYEYAFTGQDGDNAGEFAAVPNNDIVTGNALDHVYALYPHSSSTKISNDGVITATLPAYQSYKANSFGIGANTMVSVTNDTKLMFRNVGGYLSFKFYGDGVSIKSITLKGNNCEKLAGKATITMAVGGTPTVVMQEDATESISLTCETPVVLGADADHYTEFWFVLPPTTFTQGFTVRVTDDQGRVFEKSTSSPITISRNNLSRMSPTEVVPVNIATTLFAFLPDDIGKETITEIKFHVKDATVTEHQLSASVPVYYEKTGSTVNIYTSAELYDISDVAGNMFYLYSSLKSLDLSKTITPNAGSFFRMFDECVSLESIAFGDWDTHLVQNMDLMFMRCEKLRTLDLSFMDTGNVGSMASMFALCKSLSSLNVGSFNTSKVSNMNSMFAECRSLSSLDLHSFDTRSVTGMFSMFISCDMLQTLDLSSFHTENVTNMSQMFCECQNLKQLNISSFNTANVENFSLMFYGCDGFENLDLSHFVTTKAENMHFMFGWCTSLKNLDISSFTSESLQTAELMFGSCQKLQKLDLGAFDISAANCQDIGQAIMRTSKSGAIRCIPETKAILEPTMDDSLSGKVEWMSLSDDISTYEYQRDPNLYYSSDFSKHETVKKLYSATKGKGIDIVLMGDVYSDRMIASGLYDADMELAVDAIFAKEPMASYKDYFNIYIVYLVSDNEVIGESTALYAVASGAGIDGYASAYVPDKYRILATGNGDLTVQEAIVIINGTGHVSGYANMTAWDFDVPYYDCDYGRGYSSIIVARGNHNESSEFMLTVAHEFGHSFAKLADEYATEDTEPGEGPTSDILTSFSRFGWYKNVDVTSDPATIRWSRFLSDERYANENLGTYEGGFTYAKGVWRPSENSIMRYGTEFNAPSRAAIYNRIHKLAYGDDWQFDYETFVQQDIKNIPPQPASQSAVLSSARVNRKHLFKMEESTAPDGKKMVTIIMD